MYVFKSTQTPSHPTNLSRNFPLDSDAEWVGHDFRGDLDQLFGGSITLKAHFEALKHHSKAEKHVVYWPFIHNIK